MKEIGPMANKSNIQFSPTDCLSNNIVFVDGITRSGKFWLVNFLHQIENMEHVRHDPTMDHIAVANFFKLIDDNVAVSLLQSMLDRQAYETLIGRNLNLRYADSSSVFKNPDLQKYLIRVFGPDIDPQLVYRESKENNSWFVFLAHDWLSHLRIQYEAFPTMKLIRVERNPVDLVNAWYTKGIGRDRMNFGIRIKGTSGSVPWFTYPWLDSFDTLCEMDRIILSILTLESLAKETYRSLPVMQQQQILFVSYETMASSPLNEIKTIAEFLQTSVRNSVSSFVAGNIFQKRGMANLTSSRELKMQFIQKHASTEMFQRLEEAAEEYEQSQQKRGAANV
jgi:hypothetical protein